MLSDTNILARLADGSLKISPYDERNLTPNGYDVTVDEIWIPSNDTRVKNGTPTIPGESWFVVGTREYLELSSDIVGEIWIRTTWARRGVLSSFGRIDAGFHGNLTFSALNASKNDLEISMGERFAQVVFEELLSPPKKSYSERSGNYHGQKGITLEPKNHRN